MPAKIKKVGSKYRVVEPSGKIMRANKKSGKGKAVDGGGKSKAAALAQVGAINTPKSKKRT
jgi:hypothetical protein